MNRALIIKELRECAPVAALAALGAAYTVWVYTRGVVFPGMGRSTWPVPFVNDDIYGPLLIVAGGLAVVLGFKQTVHEDVLGTYRYVLHRPVDRRQVFLIKALVGLSLVQTIGAAVILGYALWAATPGTHASPFFWSMTAPTWKVWTVLPLGYLGAALSGLRPARWYGSRLLPLVGSAFVAVFLFAQPWWWMTAAGTIVVGAVLTASLLYVSQTRDY
jgi:hypothetical protein